MKVKMSRKEAKERINEFFKRNNFTAGEARKIKRLAMKFNIKLGSEKRRRFCGKCFSKLKGKTRVGRIYKTVVCGKCGEMNRFRMK